LGRLWFLAQIDAYEYGFNGVGWFFWNMKIEQGDYSGRQFQHRKTLKVVSSES
jgi:hypothetical protein